VKQGRVVLVDGNQMFNRPVGDAGGEFLMECKLAKCSTRQLHVCASLPVAATAGVVAFVPPSRRVHAWWMLSSSWWACCTASLSSSRQTSLTSGGSRRDGGALHPSRHLVARFSGFSMAWPAATLCSLLFASSLWATSLPPWQLQSRSLVESGGGEEL
jgi:hypothetical protein